MSLLLDALKKAAEQKAEKSRQAEADMAAAAGEAARDTKDEQAVESQQTTDDLDRDDTQLTGANLEPAQNEKPLAETGSTDDDTNLTGNIYDQTQTKAAGHQSVQNDDDTELQLTSSVANDLDADGPQQDEDDTQVVQFGSEVKADDDDTELTGAMNSEPASEDVQLGSSGKPAGEDTQLTDAGQGDETGDDNRPQTPVDETDMSVTGLSGVFDEDETVVLTDEDVGDFMGDGKASEKSIEAPDEPDEPPQSSSPEKDAIAEDVTSLKNLLDEDPTVVRDNPETDKASSDPVPADEVDQEDYSISLFDRDYSQPASGIDSSELSLDDQSSAQNTSGDYSISLFDENLTPIPPELEGSTKKEITDPGLENADKTGLRSLTLIDISESSLDEDFTRSDITAPSQITADLEAPSKTITRQDSTSTQTYAPDNYDRTLQRPETRDSANVFSGMKSETGDILTPEHAKQIFHSKSASHRWQNLKIYSGLTVLILVVISVLGLFQLEENSQSIDSALRPLKRDPMPGLIKNTADDEFTNLFATTPGSEVDDQTVQLVENAATIVGAEVVVVDPVIDETNDGESTESVESQSGQEQQVAEESNAGSSETATEGNFDITDISQLDNESTGIIELSSKNTVTEEDRILQEAYSAYQKGKDDLALAKYNEVLGIDGGNRNALLARAAINVQNNNIELAINDYQTLLVANPKDSLAMSSMTAIANYSPQQTESLLKLMIVDEPDSPYLNFALGNAYGAQNRWQEAQGQYFTALENNPDNPNYAYNLAVSLEHIEKPDVAIGYYQRALDNYNNGLATFNRDVVDQRLEMLRQL